MDLSKEQILQIIEFIVNEDDCDTGVFVKYINESNYWEFMNFPTELKQLKKFLIWMNMILIFYSTFIVTIMI